MKNLGKGSLLFAFVFLMMPNSDDLGYRQAQAAEGYQCQVTWLRSKRITTLDVMKGKIKGPTRNLRVKVVSQGIAYKIPNEGRYTIVDGGVINGFGKQVGQHSCDLNKMKQIVNQ